MKSFRISSRRITRSEAAKKFDVDAALVSAVIKAESDFNPREMSNKGARGLMQLMPATAERFGVTDSFDPVANIYGGTRYLRSLANQFKGDMVLTLAAYNAGPEAVKKYGGIPPYETTRAYVTAVMRRYEQYRQAAGGAEAVADR